MTINDKVFGTLDYNYVWGREDLQINFLGKTICIGLTVSGEEDGVFDEEQYLAYTSLMDKWEGLHPKFIPEILDYYKTERRELGYEKQQNENYPLIETPEEMIKHIELVGINVLYHGVLGGRRAIGIAFDCSWDEENALGILLVDEEIHEIGYQDVAC